MELNFEHRKSAFESESDMIFSTPSKSKENENYINIMVKDHSEVLISKRKEFIQNYRKKQRLLALIESNTKNNINNAKSCKELSIKDIKQDPDPISRIIKLKNYIYSNQSEININFVNENINIIREWFKDYKKYLFDYQNKNLSKQIVVNRAIIYNILSLLFEPEANPIMDELDYEFLFNINNFCFYYLNLASSHENMLLYLYILFLLNNLIAIHPDVELIKATIDIKNIIHLIYTKFFSFEESKNIFFYQKSQNKNISNESENDNKLKFSNKYELFEFAFLKLIENCINYLHLNDNDIKELLSFLLSFVYYNYKNNKIKLLIYSLESLTRVNHSYLLLQNEYYNNFLLTTLSEFFHKNNINNSHLIFIKNKLVLELYLQKILLFLDSYNNDEKIMNNNIDLFLNEEIITLFKKYLYSFYNEFILSNNNNKREITISEIKIIVKIIKIFCLYFDLISINNYNNNDSNIIYLNIKNKISKFLCSILILKNEEMSISLCEIILNIFTYFIKINEKNSKKICSLIIDLFNNIYTLKNINLYKNDFYFMELQKILLNDKINIHRVLLPFLNYEKYPFLIENMLDFVNKTLFFCEQYDNYLKDNKACLFDKIKKEYIDLNVFEEIENIECNSINLNIKIISENILDNFVRNQNED